MPRLFVAAILTPAAPISGLAAVGVVNVILAAYVVSAWREDDEQSSASGADDGDTGEATIQGKVKSS